jgi:hypothetical protein
MTSYLLSFIAIILLSNNAEAAYDLYFVTANGQKLAAEKALLSAIGGETVYKCQTIEPKVSKSGTSIGLKNIKKPVVQ